MRCFILMLCCGIASVADGRTVKCAIVLQDGYYKAIDTAGHVLVDSLRSGSEMYMAYNIIDEGMFPYVRDHRLGFKNIRNEIVIPPTYRNVAVANGGTSYWEEGELIETRFKDGLAVVVSQGRKFGIVDRHGVLVADTVYDYIAPPVDGAYAARRTDTLYLLDKRGKNLLRFPYRVDPKLYPHPAVKDGLLCVMVRMDGTPYVDFGAVDRTKGYDYRGPSPEAVHSYKVGFVNTRGRLVIDTVFRMGTPLLGNTESDLTEAKMSGRICGTGMRALSGMPRAPDPYYLKNDFYQFSGGRCLVWTGRSVNVINKAGDSVFCINDADLIANLHGYFVANSSSSNWYQYRTVGKASYHCGLYNSWGKLIIPSQYYEINDGGQGFFLVSERPNYGAGSYFYADSTGRHRFGRYAIADPFSGGFARVSGSAAEGSYDDYGHIDRKGHFIQMDEAWVLGESEGLILAGKSEKPQEQSKYGMMNRKYQWVLPPAYYGLSHFRNGLAAFSAMVQQADGTRKELYGFINKKGKVVLTPQYERVSEFVTITVE